MSKAAQALKAAATKSTASSPKPDVSAKTTAKAIAAKVPVADRLGKPKPDHPSRLSKKPPKVAKTSKVVTTVTVTETKGPSKPVIKKAVTIAKPAVGRKMVSLVNEIVHDAKEVTAKAEPIYETAVETAVPMVPTATYNPPPAYDPTASSLRPPEYRGLMSTTPPPRPPRDTLQSDATTLGTFALTKNPRNF
jgi:hypothetical protein